MASVDDRVVAMKFDNSAFENKVSSTIGSLDKLKGSLDFSKSKSGIDDLSAAGKGFHLDGISNAFSKSKGSIDDLSAAGRGFHLDAIGHAVDGIAARFSNMGIIAITAISNVVNRAVDAGIKLGKALSLDQVISGFQEYETNMNSIQTIMANTRSDATTLEDVNGALDELNQYSDKTIYNFSQMTKNIGTFTAAGVNLDTSVGAIKGIANLAAVSGSNAEQASSAMYQLSQALASGSVKLMDWNSIVNAGMGGEVFQKSLFDTGKALGTIKDVPLDQTFDQWKDAGNTFRDSLESGWITADVLTNTLQGFTGDLTEAQILSMGYTAEQAKEILELGKMANLAATEVKTFTQLMSTVKESVGSGWSQSFKIVLGDFEEAKNLFTGIGVAIGGVVGASADSRNELLQGWKDLGGRTELVWGLLAAFSDLGVIITTIKEVFRDLFPPMTAQQLYDLTVSFREFLGHLKLSDAGIRSIRIIFGGLFSILKIGVTIVKNIIEMFGDLFSRFSTRSGAGSGAIVDFLENIAIKFMQFRRALVEGGGIAKFFNELTADIYRFVIESIDNITKFKDKIVEAFDYFSGGLFLGQHFRGFRDDLGGVMQVAYNVGIALGKVKVWVTNFIESLDLGAKFDQFMGIVDRLRISISGLFDNFDPSAPSVLSDAADRVSERFGWLTGLGTILADTWGWIADQFGPIRDALGGFVDFLKEKFGDLPGQISEAVGKGDYDQVLDTINVGLFGGLVLLFKTFTDSFSGFGNGLFENISSAFGELTGVLEGMQAKLKAEALFEIAKAIALLTVSMLILSLIDSEALTKALIAMSVGFGQLIIVMALLNKIVTGPTDAAKLALLSGGIILLSGALLILAVAMKILSTMSWEEIGKGLVGTAGGLGLMVAAMKLLPKDLEMVKAGIGIMAIAIAMNIMAIAMKIFATMSWQDMAKGLVGVAGGLILIVDAMNMLPNDLSMIKAGVGIIAIAVAMNILALAMKIFATMGWEEMAKGLVGVGGALLIIAGATRLMPNGASMALQGVGLLAMGVGLVAVATAIKILGTMSYEDMIDGLKGIAGALAILAIGAYAMSGSLAGAIALGIMSASLFLLAQVIKEFAGMSWTDLLKGLAGIAGVLVVLAAGGALLVPVIPALLLLGAALILIGSGFALFGLGASLVASAFTILAAAGQAGVAILMSALDAIITKLPAFIASIGEGILLLVQKILDALPQMIAALSDIIGAILQLIIDNIPKIAEVFKTFIMEGLAVLKEVIPEYIATGLAILLAFLRGIRDNIGEIVTTVAEIITNFLDALGLKVPEIIESVYMFIINVLEGVIAKLVDLASFLWPKGAELIGGLLSGISEKGTEVMNWFTSLPGKVLGWIGDAVGWLKDNGVGMIAGFFTGMVEKWVDIQLWLLSFLPTILGWIGDAASWLLTKGIDMITGFFTGMVEKWVDIQLWILSFLPTLIGWIGDAAVWLVTKGVDIITGLFTGIVEKAVEVTSWFLGLPGKILGWIGSVIGTLKDKGISFISGLINGITEKSLELISWVKELPGKVVEWIGDVAKRLMAKGRDFLEGLLDGIIEKATSVMNWLTSLPGKVVEWVGDTLTWLKDAGLNLIKGLWNGINDAKQWILDKISGWVDSIVSGIEDFFGIGSPSKLFRYYGNMMGEGLALGLDDMTHPIEIASGSLADQIVDGFNPDEEQMIDNTTKAINAALNAMMNQLDTSGDFNPTITPVLDLTNVEKNVNRFGDLFDSRFTMTADLSYKNAAALSSTSRLKEDELTDTKSTSPTEIKFEQNNYSPEALTAAAIYRQTRNQIAMAKEELAVL